MKQASSTATSVGWVLRASGVLAICVGSALWFVLVEAQSSLQGPTYRVDPFWPKPLPTVTDRDGLSHQWVTGMGGASCIDSHDHIITVNRGFLPNGLLPQEGSQSIPSPPVMLYDPAGNIAHSCTHRDPGAGGPGARSSRGHGEQSRRARRPQSPHLPHESDRTHEIRDAR